jgi:hypothetical protein
MSARMTTGNSSPFALCTVIRRTPSLPSSRIGASAARRPPCAACPRNPGKDMRRPSRLPRQLRHVQHVGKRLVAGGPEHEAHVRPRVREQPRDRVGHRPPVSLSVQRREQREGVADRVQVRGNLSGHPERMKPAPLGVPSLLVSIRRAPRSGEYKQLVVRPLMAISAACVRFPRDRETPVRPPAGGGASPEGIHIGRVMSSLAHEPAKGFRCAVIGTGVSGLRRSFTTHQLRSTTHAT